MFQYDPDLKASLTKAYVGIFSNSGATYNIQDRFFSEGYFQIKITPMGANMCLLKASEEGDIEDLICETKSRWK